MPMRATSRASSPTIRRCWRPCSTASSTSPRADGAVHERELAYLAEVAAHLRLRRNGVFARIRARHVIDDGGDPYLVLEADRSWDYERLRRQYRRLVPENHPDRLIARGVPEEFVRIANDRLAAINAAWDKIERREGAGVTKLRDRASPLPQSRRAHGRPDRHPAPALHRHAGRRAGARLALQSARARSRRTISSTRTGACCSSCREERRAWHAGAVALGRRERHQFALDRHRDRQCRPSGRAARLSGRADRGADRALPRDRGAASHPAAPRARPFRRGAGPKARSRASAFPGRGSPRRASGTSSSLRRSSTGHVLRRGDAGAQVEALQALLALYGYGIEITGAFDQRTEDVVAAFQRHFRPARVDGVADRSTLETLQRLLAALP